MLASLTLALLATSGGDPQDFVVSAGETVFYDTTSGPLLVRDLVIEEGGTLRVQGPNAFFVRARRQVVVDGVLDLSGFDAKDVATLNTGNQLELGGAGGPGGGTGGSASTILTDSTPAGSAGSDDAAAALGGGGGESGFAPQTLGDEARRPAGGGGGALALDQPESDDPSDPDNDGLVAEPGVDGDAQASGAQTSLPPAKGGAAGTPVFVDGDPSNDFFGTRLDENGDLVLGELSRPLGGRGGGGGGDALPSSVFPTPNWTPASDEKGGGGGGGGGLGIVFTRELKVGALGQIKADGGQGARGENTLFLNSIGGNGGGGSGGYLVLQALTIDLSEASDSALRAVGGLGGVDAGGTLDGDGGNGGPGVIQLHTPGGAGIVLPAGQTLADVSRPDAWSLLFR